MVESLYAWIKNIAFYLIFITAVFQMIPNRQYQKYIKLFTGMLLVMFIMSPVSKWFGTEDVMEQVYLKDSFSMEMKEIKADEEAADRVRSRYLLESYKKQIEEKVKELIKAQDLYPVSVCVQLSEEEDTLGEPVSIVIEAALSEAQAEEIIIEKIEIQNKRPEVESVQEVELKNTLEQYYGIDRNNIYITIQR